MTFHAPQIIWCVLALLGLAAYARKSWEDFIAALIVEAGFVGLFWWGGFFGPFCS